MEAPVLLITGDIQQATSVLKGDWWGIISAIIGFVVGVIIRLFTEYVFKKRRRVLKGKKAEVILIVKCTELQGDLVENILWEHSAMGVAKVI